MVRIFLKLAAAAGLIAGARADYDNCVQALHAGESSGTFSINGDDVYCDMDIDGGGWAYVARGTYSSDGCTDDAFGTSSTDPDTNSRWSFGTTAINAIGHADGGLWMEYLVTIGHDNDNGYTAHDMYRKQRIFQDLEMGAPLDGTFGVETWYGNGYVPEPDDCSSSDCGPCWEPNDVNYCCEKDDGDFLTVCDIASQDQEGQWSNANTNQHLRCDTSDYDQDQLVMYVRPKVFYADSTECFASCLDVMQAGYGSGVYCINDQNLYCNQELHGGGWALVARGSDVDDACNAGPYGAGPCSDLYCNDNWSIGSDAMNAIGNSGWMTGQESDWIEYIFTMGYNNDEGYTPHEYYRVYRIFEDIDMSQPLDVTFGVETWDGSSWVAQTDDCSDSDCGPCSEPNDQDYCCTSLTECDIASIDKEGQWSNSNTNQHLRCDNSDYDQDSLVMYVRPGRGDPPSDLTGNVTMNRLNIAANFKDIANNADAISANSDDIADNAAMITAVTGLDNDIASGSTGVIIGGQKNNMEGEASALIGGKNNLIRADYAALGGGLRNYVVSNYGTVAGGYNNMARGRFSAVLGGSTSRATGRHSFTLGSFAQASGDYSAVINAAGTSCTAENDNEIVICADTVSVVSGQDTIDLTSLGRRMLEMDDVEDLHSEMRLLRDENANLLERIEALEKALLSQ